MASTYKTPNIGLTQYVETDKPSFTDYNNDMKAIDKACTPEYGTNANGSYIKYQDGTLICMKNIRFNNIPMPLWTKANVSSSPTIELGNWACNFLSGTRPFVSVTLTDALYSSNGDRAYLYLLSGSRCSNTFAGVVFAVSPLSTDDRKEMDIEFSVIGYGRWK